MVVVIIAIAVAVLLVVAAGAYFFGKGVSKTEVVEFFEKLDASSPTVAVEVEIEKSHDEDGVTVIDEARILGASVVPDVAGRDLRGTDGLQLRQGEAREEAGSQGSTEAASGDEAETGPDGPEAEGDSGAVAPRFSRPTAQQPKEREAPTGQTKNPGDGDLPWKRWNEQ